MRRPAALVVVLAALLTLAVAPVPVGAQAPRALVVQAATEPPGLDLTATPASATAGVVLYNVQECLVKVDAHGKLVPWLAERWHTADNRNYTFFLKRGVRFHNGRELRAADVKFVIERNPEYHVKGLPKLDQVTFRFIPDPNAALAALKAGDIDVSLFGLGPEHVADLKKDGRYEVIVGETTNDVVMSMNNSRKPFSDVRVRRAITHAINKADVVKLAMFGMGRVIGSNVDPLNPYFVDLANAVPYDPARAKRLLAEAGYPNGFSAVLKVAPQYYYTVRAGEVITDQLKKVGVNVKIEQIEWGQWLDRVFCRPASGCKEPDYDLTIIGHAEAWDIGNYANPKYYFRYDSPRFQEIYAKSETTIDDKVRRDLYVQMQRMLADDAPVVFLFIHPRLG